MGIDQVVEFEVITAEGKKVTASKCENDDLFWALRGGGGGSFGVTTSVHYKLYPVKPFCLVYFHVADYGTTLKWISLLVDFAPQLDNKWGGYWKLFSGQFYYQGNESELKNDTFYKKILALGNFSSGNLRCAESFFGSGPDQTGHKT
eukprot:TRINITY_DN5461_c0_g1_i1.p1 TRINITY_DN5461_c0_g1~~TRINITY_DN5461_c0_g1_i1.p1  ORF type:complete len:147 (+),score=19.02 TRINITY_DN5461_c0_g1_i1:309-749(+)